MNERHDNFQDVKRLLKLKRHEVPPPGYFNGFSSQVISRIREGEALEAQSLFERLKHQAPWLFNVLHVFEARPGLIGGLATSVCLMVVFGLVVADHTDTSSISTFSANNQPSQVFAATTPVASATTFSDPLSSSGITLSTNPVTSLQPVATLFGQPSSAPLFQNAGFQEPGH